MMIKDDNDDNADKKNKDDKNDKTINNNIHKNKFLVHVMDD